MKEFVEKLISRLEEKLKYNSEQAEIWRSGSDKDAYFREKKDLYLDRANTYGEVMRIVNQLAEEYINCSTDTSTNTSSGWISCSERLPEDSGRYLVDNGIWRGEGKFDIAIKEFNVSYVIAWQPLPAPYTPKEGRE